MITKENILQYRPEQISFDKENLLINGEKFPCKNPRLEFARALAFFTPDFDRNFKMYGHGEAYSGIRIPVANNTIYGKNIEIGHHCIIGDSGFGFEKDEQGILVQMPHLGRVWIGDNVVIRNHVCIDRAVVGETVIGEGTVIDNLVHVAHGVKIGKNCLIVAGVVLGGSCEVGDGTFIGMNVSIKNKITIGKNCIIGAGAVVLKDVQDNEVWVGNPAKFLKHNS